LRQAAAHLAKSRPEVLRVGFFGSYARGDWGPGSDLDVAIVVADSERPFAGRSPRYPLEGLPVPADVLIYTVAEWERLAAAGGRFAEEVIRRTRWVFRRDEAAGVGTME
jgi:predicted nucleotidyltransferase